MSTCIVNAFNKCESLKTSHSNTLAKIGMFDFSEWGLLLGSVMNSTVTNTALPPASAPLAYLLVRLDTLTCST